MSGKEMLVAISSAPMKCTKSADGLTGTVEALGILYDSAGKDKDLEGEFFTASTYFGKHRGNGMDASLNHRIPIATKSDEANDVLLRHAKRTFANPVQAIDGEFGIVGRHVLNLADEFEAWVFAEAAKGSFKWSAGSAPHMAEIKADGEITSWPIIEWAYTPYPSQPLNPRIVPIKSLSEILPDPQALMPKAPGDGAAGATDGDAALDIQTRARAYVLVNQG